MSLSEALNQIELPLHDLKPKLYFYTKSVVLGCKLRLGPHSAARVGWKLPPHSSLTSGLATVQEPTCYFLQFDYNSPRRTLAYWSNGEFAADYLWQQTLSSTTLFKATAVYPSAEMSASRLALSLYRAYSSSILLFRLSFFDSDLSAHFSFISPLGSKIRAGLGLTRYLGKRDWFYTLGATYSPRAGRKFIMLYEGTSQKFRMHYIQNHGRGSFYLSLLTKPNAEHAISDSRVVLGISRQGERSGVRVQMDSRGKIRSRLKLNFGRMWVTLGATLRYQQASHFGYFLQADLA